jgi:zinc D-Ala-D-Ala carboxypeptidase
MKRPSRLPINLILFSSFPLIFMILILFCCGGRQGGLSGQTSGDQEDIMMLPGDIRPDTLVDTAYLLGKFNPTTHPLFIKAGKPCTTLTDAYLRAETVRAFGKMQDAAKKDGISLMIVSATRNFDIQKGIWEAKWNGTRKVEGVDLSTVKDPYQRAKAILRYSSMPGTSRHHWGTDLDINSVDPAYFQTLKGEKEYNWLKKNASNFGFGQPYTSRSPQRPSGYEEEVWHWSYLPLSKTMLAKYNELINSTMIHGFQGDETADSLQVIRYYVNGINPECK